jgi:hypothetical protein
MILTAHTVIRMNIVGEHVAGVVDYVHYPWIILAAVSVTVASPSQSGAASKHPAEI